MKLLACIIFALTACIMSNAWASQARANFTVSVRVLPHCDQTRRGGLMQTTDGRFVCVYPSVTDAPGIPVEVPTKLQRTGKSADIITRTIVY